MNIVIERANEHDLRSVFQLLESHGLPVDGLAAYVGTTFVARRDGRVVGSAALETYPDGVLLRSVAVAPEVQRQGVGRRLTEAAVENARRIGAPAVYLLTVTAEEYFPKLGFERIDRAAVPASVKTSIEFTSACCSSAAVMRRTLAAPQHRSA